MMSVSGHKFGCPKGIGFLYKSSKIDIEPLIHGGGQEFGLRAGTENLPYIAGISKTVDLLKYRSADYYNVLSAKRDYLKYKLLEIKGSKINGSDVYRLCNNINISFKGIKSDALLAILDGNGISYTELDIVAKEITDAINSLKMLHLKIRAENL